MMKKNFVFFILLAFLCIFSAPSANAATATVSFEDFSYITNLFQTPSINGNVLDFDVTGFKAEATGGLNPSLPDFKTDTVYFNIVSPEGYYIDKIIYSEGLTTSLKLNGGNGITYATASAVIAGKSQSFGTHLYNSDASGSFTIGNAGYSVPGMLTSLGMSITNQIAAIAFGGTPPAQTEIFKTSATITVSLAEIPTPVPVPASILLLGSAVIGLVGVKRNRK